jgi:hypothetical protein
MAKMTLGGYTYLWNPDKSTEPREIRFNSLVHTYGGAAFFSWGTSIIGLPVVHEWNYMDETMFQQLQTFLEDDEIKVWNPQTGTNYNVQIVALSGDYLTTSLYDAPWRENVKLEMVIMS